MFRMVETDKAKAVFSDEFNSIFDKKSGETAYWGCSLENDPECAPFPMILDMEITTSCYGIGTVHGRKKDAALKSNPCPFCSPAGTKVLVEYEYKDKSTKTPSIVEKNIEDIVPGDQVVAFSKNGKVFQKDTVQEIYSREYKGELIEIELENGRVVKLTPNHKVMVVGKGWIEAGNLSETDELVSIDDYPKHYLCKNCGEVITYNKSYDRWYCSEECWKQANPIVKCLICGKEFRRIPKTAIFCGDCRKGINKMMKHPLHHLYHQMIHRCYNPKRNVYWRYGEKGIKVDIRWLDFELFLEDMESSYFEGATLDRIDNDKGYSKENCRWISIDEQRFNRNIFSNASKTIRKGIVLNKSGTGYQVQLKFHKKAYYLGTFYSLESALKARDELIKKMYPDNWDYYVKL